MGVGGGCGWVEGGGVVVGEIRGCWLVRDVVDLR